MSDIDEAGATVEIQSQTLKVARFCVREKVEAAEVGARKWILRRSVCAQEDWIGETSRSRWMCRGTWVWERRMGLTPRAQEFQKVRLD